ncbi:hypothetical protein VaNZ11_009737, partial [Volvox africanus]
QNILDELQIGRPGAVAEMVGTAKVASSRAWQLHHTYSSRSKRLPQIHCIAHTKATATAPVAEMSAHLSPGDVWSSPMPHVSHSPSHSNANVTSSTAAAAAAAARGVEPFRRPAAVVLGIESSCDDTGVAVVTSDGMVLGEAIATQTDVHAQWGGVVPNLARDAHSAAIDRTVDSALAAARLEPQHLSAIAVTVGPGLGLCLRVGAAKARQLARQYGIPLVSVHHMEAHALVARLPPAAAAAAPPAVRMAAITATATHGSASSPNSQQQQLHIVSEQHPPEESYSDAISSSHNIASVAGTVLSTGCTASPDSDAAGADIVDAAAVLEDVDAAAAVPFPFLCLLVSGGHNLMVLVRGVGQYVQLGTTVDDALGEAYDKVARLLSLDLRPHGGAALEALAREGDPRAFRFAVPMRKHATCDFSFAGLKTNTRLAIQQHLAPERTAAMSAGELRKVKADIAASFQSVAVTHLTEKTRRGVAWARELVPERLRHLVVAGGVACNQVVRSSLQKIAEDEGLELVLPPPRWCTDNGVMVAWTGIERLARGWAEPPPPPLPLMPTLASTATDRPQQPPAVATADAATTPATSAVASTSDAGADGEVAAQGSIRRRVSEPHGASPGTGNMAAAQVQVEAEWIELKPRWPLTSELHPRSAAANQELRRSVRRVRMHTPLSDMLPRSTATHANSGSSSSSGGTQVDSVQAEIQGHQPAAVAAEGTLAGTCSTADTVLTAGAVAPVADTAVQSAGAGSSAGVEDAGAVKAREGLAEGQGMSGEVKGGKSGVAGEDFMAGLLVKAAC